MTKQAALCAKAWRGGGQWREERAEEAPAAVDKQWRPMQGVREEGTRDMQEAESGSWHLTGYGVKEEGSTSDDTKCSPRTRSYTSWCPQST